MIEIAHLTDLHIGPLPRARISELLSKRILGFLSWHRKRHRIHTPETLDALLDDLSAMPPDHIVITGDLVNISLPGEFVRAANWLERLGRSEDAMLIPGNHDAYVDGGYRERWGLWRAWMRSDDRSDGRFPLVRRFGSVAVIGLSSAVPSPVGCAYGRLGDTQIQELEKTLRRLGDDGLFRIVLVHHPPLVGIGARRNLRDGEEFRRVVGAVGAELILSGHEHRFELGEIAGPSGGVPVVVGPSASADDHHHPLEGGYVRLRIDPAARSIMLQRRCIEQRTGRFVVRESGMVVERQGGLVLDPVDWSAPAD